MKPEVNPGLYQVFLISCPAVLSLGIARHHWFVVNKKGNVSRWEVIVQKDCCDRSIGHLHNNLTELYKGTGVFSFHGKTLWNPRYEGHIEGREGSAAERLIRWIESSATTYPYCQEYSLLGPNSNTYVQWVLDAFPEFPTKLGWNAFGKGYKVRV